jgi:hypothetical protein
MSQDLTEVKIANRGDSAIAWLTIFGFLAFSLIAMLVGFGKILNIAYPSLSFLVAILLYYYAPHLYLGFSWWMWFLSPFVRRVADYRSGFTEPSPILLAPFLVTLVAGIALVQNLPRTHRHGILPFSLAFIGVIYGICVGLVNSSINSALIAGLEWLVPVCFSCYIYLNWQQYPNFRRVTQTSFIWCVLISGAYGIFQYLVAPEWDKSWLINTELPSAGTPEPLGIRVWSTMHGPGVFAVTMMAGLLLLLNVLEGIGIPATIAGYLAFLLSAVRSAWVGWTVGLLSLITSLKLKMQIRLIVIALIAILGVTPLTLIEPFASVIIPRLETFQNIEEDGSGQAREALYRENLEKALTNFLGDGIQKGTAGDSAILTLLLSLGWLGSIYYVGALVMIFLKSFRGVQNRIDSFANASRAISLGMLIQFLFGSVMLGLPGTIMWGFLGFSLASEKYYMLQKRTRQTEEIECSSEF